MSFYKGMIHHAYTQSLFSDVYFYMFSHKGPLGNGTKVFYPGEANKNVIDILNIVVIISQELA